MCFGCSKEPSHRDNSFEYLQHMFWFRNKKKIQLRLCSLMLELLNSESSQKYLVINHEGRFFLRHGLIYEVRDFPRPDLGLNIGPIQK